MGLKFVVSEILELTASVISGRRLSQLSCSPSMNCAIMVLTVRLARSVGLSRGEYGAVYCNSHPSSRIYSLKARLVNYVPLSHTNGRGTPKCPRIRSRNALIRILTRNEYLTRNDNKINKKLKLLIGTGANSCYIKKEIYKSRNELRDQREMEICKQQSEIEMRHLTGGNFFFVSIDRY